MSEATRRYGLVSALVGMSLACGGRPAPATTFDSLGGDVARVGGTSIPASLVDRVAHAQGSAPRAALDGIIDDALAAEGARGVGLDRTPQVAWASTAALARAVDQRLMEQARAEGPPHDEELADITVVHAIVLRSRSLPEPTGAAVSQEIAHAVLSARSEEEFEARAQAVPSSRAVVRVEHLPAFDASGHAADGTEFDPTFVAAAFALKAPGDTSGVVVTPFGWHVIRLVSRALPAAEVLGQRRRDLADAVLAGRVRARLQDVLGARRLHERVEVTGPAEELMAEVVRAR